MTQPNSGALKPRAKKRRPKLATLGHRRTNADEVSAGSRRTSSHVPKSPRKSITMEAPCAARRMESACTSRACSRPEVASEGIRSVILAWRASVVAGAGGCLVEGQSRWTLRAPSVGVAAQTPTECFVA